jgi:hypothetical protein
VCWIHIGGLCFFSECWKLGEKILKKVKCAEKRFREVLMMMEWGNFDVGISEGGVD